MTRKQTKQEGEGQVGEGQEGEGQEGQGCKPELGFSSSGDDSIHLDLNCYNQKCL